MAKYKIEFDREACIGALACMAAAPKFWISAQDGKVDLKDAKYNEETKRYELFITSQEDFVVNQDAQTGCPVLAIIMTKVED